MIPTEENTVQRTDATMKMLQDMGLTNLQMKFVAISAIEVMDIIDHAMQCACASRIITEDKKLFFCRAILAASMKASGV